MKFLINLEANKNADTRVKFVCDEVERKMQTLLSKKDYGIGVTECKFNLFCESMEFYKLNYRAKFYTEEKLPRELPLGKFETNHWIDLEQIPESSERELYRIICESILVSLYILKKIKNFDYQSFNENIIALLRQERWIYIRFFMTGEMDSIFAERINFGRNSIQGKIKSYISTRDYGTGVSYWTHIIICCSPEAYQAGFFKEIKKYTLKDTDVELRLRIDYEKMLEADEHEVNKLICESILRGVDIAEQDFKIKDFDLTAFRSDLKTLFKKEGWI